MGYYTQYELEAGGELESREHKCGIESYNGWSGLFDDTVKWYEHDEDMKAYSKLHPLVLFKLSGVGEEQPDLWIKYFRNGLVQLENAVITYGEFDESKLKG